MLSGFPLQQESCAKVPMPVNSISETTWNRNFKEDMHAALDLLYKFKEGLEKLHPECTRNIERLLGVYDKRY